ncbi:MAG: glycosyltransferase family 2 protein [Tenuifilaceae bacterium]|nr:glycosyltransferase family 2 protein [Tenuifilaceae bacterium]
MQNYIIIIPAKDEAQFINSTLSSIIGQTLLPKKLIIVDDASSDNTAQICNYYTNKYNWIELVRNNHKKIRYEGTPVVEAFKKGLDSLPSKYTYDVICKIDADIIFPKEYFERVMTAFTNNPKVGMCAGQCLEEENGIWVEKRAASYHIRGALKAYRRECFEDIGGLKPVLGWDGIDEMNAMFKGWQTMLIEGLWVKHLRPTASHYQPTKLARKLGTANYKNGGNLLLLLIRIIVKTRNKPYFIWSYNYGLGYLSARAKDVDKNVSPELARFINRFHFKRIFRFQK